MEHGDKMLIKFLIREGHGSPFEHVVFRFRVTTPIFVAREWMRHRIGSFNEISARYTKVTPSFYIPAAEAVRKQVGKPGAYSFEKLDDGGKTTAIMMDAYQRAYQYYEELLDLGVARELARTVLPVGMVTQFIWTVNLRSLTNFLSLRTAPNALYEIRQEALEIEQCFKEACPVAYEAWEEFNRQGI